MSYVHPLSAYVFLKLQPTGKSMLEMIEIIAKCHFKVIGTKIRVG